MKTEPVYITPLISIFFDALNNLDCRFKAVIELEPNIYISFNITSIVWKDGPCCYFEHGSCEMHSLLSKNDLDSAKSKWEYNKTQPMRMLTEMYSTNRVPSLRTDQSGDFYIKSPLVVANLTDRGFRFLSERSSDVGNAWLDKFTKIAKFIDTSNTDDFIKSTVFYRIESCGHIDICMGLDGLIPLHHYDWTLNEFVPYDPIGTERERKPHNPTQNLNYILGKTPNGVDETTKWYFDKFKAIKQLVSI